MNVEPETLEPIVEPELIVDENGATSVQTIPQDVKKQLRQARNRAERRQMSKNKIRLTKKLKKIRGKYWYGDVNVTDAIRKNIPITTFVYVNKFGYSLKDIQNAIQ